MKNLDLPKEEVIKCFHCGNETLMSQKGEYSWGSRDIEYDDFNFLYEYELFACPVCHKVTLRETYDDETMVRPSYPGEMEWYSNERILYPINSIDSGSIPLKVKEAYEAALKTKGIDKNLCLMALRRTLELILKDKGATKWGLKDKIEEIAKKGLLPDTLKEASSLTKILGDSAAHDKELDIDQHDVESMAEFIEFIIEYLYIVPDKINTYKERLSSKTDGKEEV
ncbi:MAG: DUF4145 domain-containing protein [Lutisporaceae bacterium]